MTPIEIIALVIGILMVVTRLPGLIWPREFLEWFRKNLFGSTSSIKKVALASIVLGAIFLFYVFRAYGFVDVIVVTISAMIVVFGIVSLTLPEVPRSIISSLKNKDKVIRITCAVKILIGLVLIYLILY